jgi:hypothetical protein
MASSRIIVTLALVASFCISQVSAFMPAAYIKVGTNRLATAQEATRRRIGSKSLPLAASASTKPDMRETQGLTESNLLRRDFLSVAALAGFLSTSTAYAAEDKGEGKKGGQTSTTSSGSGEQGSTTLGCDTPKPKPGEPEICETDY